MKTLEWLNNPVKAFRDFTGEEPYIYQEEVLKDINDFSKNRMLICSGSGLGKTFLLAFIGLYSAYIYSEFKEYLNLKEPYSVLIASGNLAQAQYLYEYSTKFINNVEELKRNVKGEPRKTFTIFKNGGTIRALPSADESLYSYHANLFIIDEGVIAEAPLTHMYRIIKGKNPNRIIIASTPHDFTSKFVELWINKEKYPEWYRYYFNPEQCRKITKEELEEARRGLPEDKFRTLILGLPTPPSDSYFNLEDLRKCRVQETFMGEGEVRIGVDWGFTTSKTGIVIVQIEGNNFNVLHAELVSNPRMEDLLGKIEAYWRRYNATRIYTDQVQKGENQRLRERGLPVTEVYFSKERGFLMTSLKTLIEQHRLKIPEKYSELIRQLAYYSPDKGKDDDLVDALALCCYMGVYERPKWYIKSITLKK